MNMHYLHFKLLSRQQNYGFFGATAVDEFNLS